MMTKKWRMYASLKWLIILPAASWHVFTSSTAALVACFEEAWSLRTATCLKEGATMDVAIATMCSASLRSSPAVIHKNLSRELTSYQSTNQSYVLPFIKDLASWNVILAFLFREVEFWYFGSRHSWKLWPWILPHYWVWQILHQLNQVKITLPMAALSWLVATPLASWAILDVALARSLIAFSSRLRESWSSLSAWDLSACIRSLVASTSAFACLRRSFLSVIGLCVCERQWDNC